MIRKLAHLGQKQRWMLSSSILTVTALLCYVLITHGSVSELCQAHSMKNAKELEQQGLVLVNAELEVAQKTLARIQSQTDQIKALYCTEEQAVLFFEQITTWATHYQLTPISRVITSPESLMPDPNGIRLISQSADIVLQGHIQDMIAFLDMLVDRPQQVSITNLHVGLIPGENLKPQLTFRVVLMIDPSTEGKSL